MKLLGRRRYLIGFYRKRSRERIKGSDNIKMYIMAEIYSDPDLDKFDLIKRVSEKAKVNPQKVWATFESLRESGDIVKLNDRYVLYQKKK